MYTTVVMNWKTTHAAGSEKIFTDRQVSWCIDLMILRSFYFNLDLDDNALCTIVDADLGYRIDMEDSVGTSDGDACRFGLFFPFVFSIFVFVIGNELIGREEKRNRNFRIVALM